MSEATKWYGGDGLPMVTAKTKTGKDTKPTLRQARMPENEMYPSVTSVIGSCWPKPGLIKWQIGQGILIGEKHKRTSNELDKDYIDRVIGINQDEVGETAETGKSIHAEIEEYLTKDNKPTSIAGRQALSSIIAWIAEMKIVDTESEKTFSNKKLGFGGTIDFVGYLSDHNLNGYDNDVIVGDFKTTLISKFKKPYDEWGLQLAAYILGIGVKKYQAWSIVIDRYTGETKYHKWQKEDIDRYIKIYQNLLEVWFLKNKFDPRGEG